MTGFSKCLKSALLIVAGLSACSKDASLPMPEPIEPASREEAVAFGEELLVNFQTCNKRGLLQQLELPEAGRLAIGASSLRGSAMVAFAKDFEKGWSVGLPQTLSCDSTEDMHFRIEGYRKRDGFPTVIISELDGEVTIREFIIGRASTGEVVSRDFIDWATGLSFQNELTAIVNLLSEDYFRAGESMKVVQAFDSGGGLDAFADLAGLSELTQRNPKIMISALAGLAMSGEDMYWEYREDYRAQYPNNPEPHYLDMAARLSAGRWDKALESLNALDEELGGLPGLRVSRARFLQRGGSSDKAAVLYRELISESPADGALRLELMSLLVDNGDYAAAVATAKELFALDTTFWDQDGAEEAGWQDFATSSEWAEYQEWLSPRLAALEADPEEG